MVEGRVEAFAAGTFVMMSARHVDIQVEVIDQTQLVILPPDLFGEGLGDLCGG
jgi:hypothetical protein